MYDGSNTIDDVIDRLNRQIAYFKKMKKSGWNKIENASDDYIIIWNPDKPRTDIF